jgi:hypothetical protein|tara:strand:- start:3534 stop:4298 length:765 start_codon:yes stop_codon:yes gene_type:complete
MTKLNLPVYFSTNDKHTICLKVCADLYEKFWESQEFNVLGYTPIDLGEQGTFHSMGEQGAVQDWSTDLRQHFRKIKDDFFIYGSEDVAFVERTDVECLNQLTEIIQSDPTIGRINLVDPCEGGTWYTRENNPHYKTVLYQDFGDWGLYEQTKESNYSVTTQLSIWSKQFFLRHCQAGLTPWEFELKGSENARKDGDYRVLMVYGDKYPINKREAFESGEWDRKEDWFHLISPQLREEINLWEREEKHKIKYSRT